MHIPILDGLIASTLRKSPPRHISNPDDIVGWLPEEVVQHILDFHVPSVISGHNAPPFYYNGEPNDRKSFGHTLQVKRYVDEYRKQVRSARQSLMNVLLVCKTWYYAGERYLYMYPTLLSNQHTVMLSDTLKRVPSMRLARDLTAVYESQLGHSPEKLLSILQNSPELHTLTIIYRDSLLVGGSPFEGHLTSFQSVATRLRRLTLYGGDDWTKVLKLSFPNLEHLCLQQICMPDNDILTGDLPKLHTLQLVQVKFDVKSFEIWCKIGHHVRNLQTLEVYLTDHERIQAFMTRGCLFLHNLKTLTFGVIDTRASSGLGDWRFPYNLENLTLLVNINHQELPDVPDWTLATGMGKLLQNIQSRYPKMAQVQLVSQYEFECPGDAEKPPSNDETRIAKNAGKDIQTLLRGMRNPSDLSAKGYIQTLIIAKACDIPLNAVWCGQSYSFSLILLFLDANDQLDQISPASSITEFLDRMVNLYLSLNAHT